MTKLEGINPDERVVHVTKCRYQKFSGDLVVTDKGIVFLKYEGTFITRGSRTHDFPFEDFKDKTYFEDRVYTLPGREKVLKKAIWSVFRA